MNLKTCGFVQTYPHPLLSFPRKREPNSVTYPEATATRVPAFVG